jgi:TolB-like protein/tetratricopeptide (TPR) repeat protein
MTEGLEQDEAIAHVLAIDVVGYSTLLIDQQTELVVELARLVRGTARFRAAAASDKLIRLPSGDGMYLVFYDSFLSPIECAIEIATALRDQPSIRLRMGIHSGPVRRVVDVNDRSNAAGAGIDFAQRVMDCGDAGHILLSRRVADDLAPYPRWHPYLRSLGSCEVKHGVRIELVNYHRDGVGNPAVPVRLRRDAASALPSAPVPGRSVRAIAVLPLENLAGQHTEEYFAEGMTEALITDLAKVGLKVISRGSVMGFKGSRPSLAEIGRALDVATVVEGSVLRSGSRVRISARLVDVQTEECLWAERYDRDLADVLALQDDVARAVAASVGRALQGQAPDPRRRVDPEVFLLDLRARHLWHQRTEAGFRAALRVFDEAVARDPAYAPAYLGIAESLNMLANYGLLPPKEVRPRALAAVERALELDPDSADAHRLLAFVHWQYDFRWQDAVREYERALELAPNSPDTTYWFGACLAVIGDLRRSDEVLGRARALDPLSLIVPSVQGWSRIFARRFEDALPYLDEVLRIDPDFHLALWFRGEALTEMGRHVEAVASLERAYERSGRTSRLLGYLGHAVGRAGDAGRARECLEELAARARSGAYVPPYFPALVHAGLREHAAALDRLDESYATGDTMLRDVKADPHWDALRVEPRFRSLMARMAFPPGDADR